MAVDVQIDWRARDVDVPGTIYLIHLNQRLKHAGHYLGWALDLENRLECHRKGYAGHASNFMHHVALNEIEWVLAASWPSTDSWAATRRVEANIKSWGSLARICPICCGVPAENVPIKLTRASDKRWSQTTGGTRRISR